MFFLDPMSSLLISDSPIEHQTGVDVSTGDLRIAEDNRLGEGDRDDLSPLQSLFLRSIISTALRIREVVEQRMRSEYLNFKLLEQRLSALQDRLKEMENSHHSLLQAPKPSVSISTGDIHDNMLTWVTRLKIALKESASAHAYMDSSLHPDSIDHTDLCPSNILLDSKREPNVSCFGLSRIHHVVPTHNRLFDTKLSGKPSAKRGIEIKIDSHKTHWPTYFSVPHHPLNKMLPSARKQSGDMFASCERLITSKWTIGDIFKGWISEKPKYETPNAGLDSDYVIRKLFGIRNGLNVNGSQQHSEPDSCRSCHGKMVNTKTSASWIVATSAPHHATGDRNLLSGFTMEHDDLFVHAVNRVPMKVLARGAVVTDALILPDVWFVPGLTENVVSVSQLAELDHSIGFGRGECSIRSAPGAKIVGKGRLQKDGQYVLDYLKVPLAI